MHAGGISEKIISKQVWETERIDKVVDWVNAVYISNRSNKKR